MAGSRKPMATGHQDFSGWGPSWLPDIGPRRATAATAPATAGPQEIKEINPEEIDGWAQ